MTENWIDIKNYEGIYQVSDLGNIKSLSRKNRKTDKILKPLKTSGGYLQVCLSKDSNKIRFTIHVLVAQAFLGYTINGKMDVIVDHKDRNKENNRLDNLQLITQRENTSKDKENYSGFTGVYKSGDKFVAKIWVKGKRLYLGTFDTPKEAYKKYKDKKK